MELILGSTGDLTIVLEISSLSFGSMCCCISLIAFWKCKSDFLFWYLFFFLCYYLAIPMLSSKLHTEVSTEFSVQSAHIECCRRNSRYGYDLVSLACSLKQTVACPLQLKAVAFLGFGTCSCWQKCLAVFSDSLGHLAIHSSKTALELFLFPVLMYGRRWEP